MESLFMALDEAPEGVKVECYVDFVKIGSTCTADETVPVQIYINLLWRDDRHPNGNDLGYKTPEEAADNATDAPESAWRPLIGVSNIESDWVSEASPVTCGYREPSNDGPHNLNMFVFYHCVGTLSNPMNLKNFPFDSDTIEIHLDPSRAYQVGLGSLQPHGHKAGTGISFFAASVLPLGASAEWKIYDVSSVSSMGDYGFPCPQLRLYLHCARNPLFYLQKPILLLFILTNFMFLCFVLDPIEDFNDRINYLLTNILATSAFLFGIGANLPTLPYLTVFDQLIMTSFISAFIIGFETAIANMRIRDMHTLDSAFGILMYVGYVLLTLQQILPGWSNFRLKDTLDKEGLLEITRDKDRYVNEITTEDEQLLAEVSAASVERSKRRSGSSSHHSFSNRFTEHSDMMIQRDRHRAGMATRRKERPKPPAGWPPVDRKTHELL